MAGTTKESVKVSSEVLDRLREHLVREHGGHIWGKLSATVELAIVEYLDKRE